MLQVVVTYVKPRHPDVIDTFDGADFYPEVTIDGTTFGDIDMQIEDDDNPTPNWMFTKTVDLFFGATNLPTLAFSGKLVA